MNRILNPVFLLSLAAVALVFAGAMWILYVRPASQQSAAGVITQKNFQPARTLTRTQGGPLRESWTREHFTVPDTYVFTIRLDGEDREVTYAVVAQAAEHFQVGQKVTIRYEERGLLFLQRHTRVTDMAAR
jgi:hypothetical protein